jgi:hypothetical protein
MADNETLMRDALATIESLQAKVEKLTNRCAELEGDLAKARGGETSVRGAILKSLRSPGSGVNPAVDPGALITKIHGGSEAVKKRRSRGEE